MNMVDALAGLTALNLDTAISFGALVFFVGLIYKRFRR